MEKNIKLLKGWLDSLNLKAENNTTLKTIHVDELINKSDDCTARGSNKEIFFKSLKLYYDFIIMEYDYDLYAKYSLSLCFFLKSAKQLELNLEEGDIWDNLSATPPSIYLTPITNFIITKRIELYQKPLNLEVFKPFKGRCFINYICSKAADHTEKDAEYFRAVEIECCSNK